MAWKGQAWTKRPRTLTNQNAAGFSEYHLHWNYRPQPDLGGALNYAWASREAPIKEMLGTSVAAIRPFRPIGQMPMIPVMMRPVTGLGGNVTGAFTHQPLIDPNGNGPGGMTGAPPQLTMGLA